MPFGSDKFHRLGDLQLRIMKVLWQRGEAAVSDVHQSLSGPRNLAYTTVATMLRKMEARRLVSHRVEGRSFVYRPAVAEDAVASCTGPPWPRTPFRAGWLVTCWTGSLKAASRTWSIICSACAR